MNIIASVDDNWGIGKNNDLLDHFKEDMNFFKNKTVGNIVIMGRATLESLPGGKPLPNRENVVLTRNSEFKAENVTVFDDINKAAEYAKSKYPSENIYFIGGADVYKQALEICDTAYITKFNYIYDADRFIPNLDDTENWEITESRNSEVEKNGVKRILTFVTYKKVGIRTYVDNKY